MTSVAIVIPCFNAGAALRESVDSALGQSHPEVRVVVVDDGSTDAATLGILDELAADPRLTVVRQANAGAPAARNRGIALGLGAYVQPLDADDRLSPTYVAEAAARLDADPELGVAYGTAEFFGALSGRFDLAPFSVEALANDNVVHVGGMFRHADWEAVGGYREDLRGLQDYDLWIRLAARGVGFALVPAITYFYRQGGNTITDSYARTRETWAAARAAVFRGNVAFFVEHAEALYERRHDLERRVTELEEEVRSYSGRLGVLRALRASVGRALGRPRVAR